MAEVSIDVLLKSAKTQADLEKVRNIARQMRKENSEGTQEYLRGLAAERTAKEEILRLNSQVDTSYQKMMKSYFKHGEIIRRTMVESTQSVGVFASAFGATGLQGALTKAVGAIDQTNFAVTGIAKSLETSTGKLASFGAAISGLAVPLSILGGGLLFVINQYRELANAADAAAKATGAAFMTSAEKRLQASDPAAYMATLERQRGSAVTRENQLQGTFIRLQAEGGIATPEGQLAAMAALVAYKEWQAAQKERLRLDDLIWEARQKEKKIAESAAGNLGTPAPLPEDVELVAPGRPIGRVSAMAGAPLFNRSSTWLGINQERYDYRQRILSRRARGVGGVEFAKTELEGLNPAIMSIGQTLSSSLSQGFLKGFQKGEDFLQSFTESILSAMASIAAHQAAAFGVAGLLSLIPGVGTFGSIFGALGGLFKFAGGGVISEPVVGFGTKSGRGYMMGEKGNELVTPLDGMDITGGGGGLVQEMRAVRHAIQGLGFGVTPEGIYVTWDRGRAALGQ